MCERPGSSQLVHSSCCWSCVFSEWQERMGSRGGGREALVGALGTCISGVHRGGPCWTSSGCASKGQTCQAVAATWFDGRAGHLGASLRTGCHALMDTHTHTHTRTHTHSANMMQAEAWVCVSHYSSGGARRSIIEGREHQQGCCWPGGQPGSSNVPATPITAILRALKRHLHTKGHAGHHMSSMR